MTSKIIIHYSEIALKGENRSFFEQKLINNIKTALGKSSKKVYKKYGKIVCDLAVNADIKIVKKILGNIPGIAYFSFAETARFEIEDIKKKTIHLLKNIDFKTFKVDSKRSNKNFPYTSREINEKLGEHVIKRLNKKAKMKEPDVKVFIEVSEKEAYVYTEKHKGVGGLPVTSSGKVVCLLSGGIDSPVAAYLMMKRGCKVIFVHVLNKSLTTKRVVNKINKIVKELSKFQSSSKLYIVPFEGIQKEIISKVDSKNRMIIYRRFMALIANRVAFKENAKMIVTGDSIGQVASQTLENLKVIYDASTLPILSPLIGLNKEEIIIMAKNIGTYEHSIIPYPDCCSFMISKHPETRAELENIKGKEVLIINRDELVKNSIKESEVKLVSNKEL